MKHKQLPALLLLAIFTIPSFSHADSEEGEYREHDDYRTDRRAAGTDKWQWSNEELRSAVWKPTYYFIQFDANFDMLIDESEFRQAKVDRSGLKAFSALDSDNNGKIDVAEFELLNR